MTIAVPYVHVPVRELEIVTSASRAEFEQRQWVAKSEAGSAVLALRTLASKTMFRRRVKFWDVRIGSVEDFVRELEDERAIAEDATFHCELGGYPFFATYNLRTRTGKLMAIMPVGELGDL